MSDDIIKRLREAIAAGPTPIDPDLYGDRYFSDDYSRCDLTKEQDAFVRAASPDNIAALLDRLDKAERENERLRAERDEHARWREKLADDLHERESQIIDGWAALRDSGVQSEKNIADGIKLLRAENEALAADARRYRWLRGDACPDHSVRWTQWEVRCWVAPFWSDDLRREGLDRSIDAAMAAERLTEGGMTDDIIKRLREAIAARDELRRQLDECSKMLARRAATIRGLIRTAGES